MKRIKKGLDLPIQGEPDQTISNGPAVRTVAIVGDDYNGMKPTLEVREGDRVKKGQVLFTDKKTPGVCFTSPVAGTVAAINRGEKRVFQSLVINADGDEQETFTSWKDADFTKLTREQVTDNLVQSGLWTAFRTRPYSKVPAPGSVPNSIFVAAMDTNPLAANPLPIIREQENFFLYGMTLIQHLTDGKVYLCHDEDEVVPGRDLDGVTTESFDGPHPAGLPGTHIHFLDPVSSEKTVWFLNYQDVIAIGRLFATGELSTERVISLAGPGVRQPRLVRTVLGASLDELTEGELTDGSQRVISGSVLSGRLAKGPFAFLGRYHLQVSAIQEGGPRELLGWHMPGFEKFSVKRVFASAIFNRAARFKFNTLTNGSPRSMVPIGSFESVMPMDIIPTFLLRALIVGDTDQAQSLGCLELDEEDLSLCTFVCPGKTEYGPLLRKNLIQIEKEG